MGTVLRLSDAFRKPLQLSAGGALPCEKPLLKSRSNSSSPPSRQWEVKLDRLREKSPELCAIVERLTDSFLEE